MDTPAASPRLTDPRLAALVALTLLAAPAGAEGLVSATMLDGGETAPGRHLAALHLVLAPGWKTYWRAPGDAGIPPEFSWSGSDNLAGLTVHWPRPEVMDSYGLRVIGYRDALTLPIELLAIDPARPIDLRLEVTLGLCETICLPATLEIAARMAGAGPDRATIARAMDSRPRPADQAGVGPAHCELIPISDGLSLRATIPAPDLGGEEVVLVEPADPAIWVSPPETERRGAVLEVRADLVPPIGQPLSIARQDLRFTLLGQGAAVDLHGCTGR